MTGVPAVPEIYRKWEIDSDININSNSIIKSTSSNESKLISFKFSKETFVDITDFEN